MKRRRELAIELTPLLDVIMIMLFLILTRNAGNVKEAREEAAREMAAAQQQASSEILEMQETVEAAQKDAEAAREELEGLEGRVSSLEVFQEYAVIVSVQVETPRSAGASGTGEEEETAEIPRKILVVCGEESQSISFSWNSRRYAENRLKDALKTYFDGAAGMPCFVVFTYNKAEIYKSDFDLVAEVLNNLEGDHIYIRTVEE